jgi:phage terminase large subunit-like protein
MNLEEWRAVERRIDAEQIPDTPALLDTLPEDFLQSPTPIEVTALACDPEARLRARQQIPDDGDWLTTVFLSGRGWGKSFAGAGWVVQQILAGTPDTPQDFALVAPTLDDCWGLQWRTIKELLPPWVRCKENITRNIITFPDHGVTLLMHSAENTQYRGPNLRGAWCEEPIKWPRGDELWRTLRLAIRVPGPTPPRAVFTTTPPRTLDWVLDVCAEESTRVVRGRMRDNPALDSRAVDAAYRSMAGTIEGERELDGRVVLGRDGALFKVDDLERYRVAAAPRLEAIVVAVDPAQSANKDADPVGIVCVGIAAGHLYVLESCSQKLEPMAWATQAIEWALLHHAGRFIVEPTGSGSYPRATLDAQMRIADTIRVPIVDSKAKGSKADRAQPLSVASAQGRLHLVGRHEDLERELTQWHPGARFSPGGLDALVHGASVLTRNWRSV